MRKRFVLFLFLSFLFFEKGNATGDSLRYLTAKDTVFLKIDYYGEKVFEHTLAQGQTLYSLAKFYGMTPEEVFFYNPQIDPEQIAIGAKVKIPIPNRALIRRPERLRDTAKFIPVFHKVRPGETLYRISNLYYKIPLDTLKNWNRLADHSLVPEQELYIGWMGLEGIPDSVRNRQGGFWWKRNYELGKKFRANGNGKTPQKEHGAAFWDTKSGRQTDELFALHRAAKPGSLVLVMNPMTRRTAFVRVLGRIPEAAYPPNVKIVLSEKTAKLLGARDPKFYVEIQYWK